MNVSPNHPTMRPINGSPRPNLSHTGHGWCPKCQTTCVLLDNFELYARDLAYDEEVFDDE